MGGQSNDVLDQLVNITDIESIKKYILQNEKEKGWESERTNNVSIYKLKN
jgi:hypothetical protein